MATVRFLNHAKISGMIKSVTLLNNLNMLSVNQINAPIKIMGYPLNYGNWQKN